MSDKHYTNIEFKILSAFAIYFVVAGHCLKVDSLMNLGGLFPIYLFHVPLFLFISGYFYNKENNESIFNIILYKAKKLLIPLFIWNFFYGVISNVLQFNYSVPLSFNSLFILPLINGHQFGLNAATWFVFPMFLTQVCYALIRKKLRNISEQKVDFVLFLIFSFLFIVISKLGNDPVNDYFLTLMRVCLFLPFFHFGVIYRKYIEKKLNKKYLVLIICIVIQLILIEFANGYKLSYVLAWCNSFSDKNTIILYLGTLNAILFWVYIVKSITRIIPKKAAVYIGNHTYEIMVHHLMGFTILNYILLLISKNINHMNFDYLAFKSDVYYQFLPFERFIVVYIIFGFLFSFIMIYIQKRFSYAIMKIKEKNSR